MDEQLIIAGFGGQGVQLIGQLLAKAGLDEGKHVSHLPSYGPEMRGGTTNCNVVVSSEPVASPIVSKATSALLLNLPSLIKFEEAVLPGGNLFYNSSLIERKPVRTDINVYAIPANEIAEALGNTRVANMVMLGAYLSVTGAVSVDSVISSLRETFGPAREKLIPVNRDAMEKGAEAARK